MSEDNRLPIPHPLTRGQIWAFAFLVSFFAIMGQQLVIELFTNPDIDKWGGALVGGYLVLLVVAWWKMVQVVARDHGVGLDKQREWLERASRGEFDE